MTLLRSPTTKNIHKPRGREVNYLKTIAEQGVFYRKHDYTVVAKTKKLAC